jgi:WhiB family redox-sensing transcriptional regulator
LTALLPTWHAQALCHTEDGDWFSDSPALVEQAKAVCGRCAVVAECLEDAVARGESEGLWGGLTAQERMAPTLMVLADPGPPPHVVSRGCYVTNRCQDPGCRAANAAYNAGLRSRGPATRGGTVDQGEQLEIGEVA